MYTKDLFQVVTIGILDSEGIRLHFLIFAESMFAIIFHLSQWLSGKNAGFQCACLGYDSRTQQAQFGHYLNRVSPGCDTLQPRTLASSCNQATWGRPI